jgi:uncharacterized protein (TIGR04141 family)
MPRQPSKAAKVSLYRLTLKSNADLSLGVQEKYLKTDEFKDQTTNIAGCSGLLVHGVIPNENPKWVEHARLVSSITISVKNQTSAGLLLVRLKPDQDHCYCLSWSMGHLLINPTYIDDGFGLRFALRKADPDEVSALTSHALDSVPKTARTSVIGGAPLDSFGLEEIGEIVSRFAGRIQAKGLSCDLKANPQKVGKNKVSQQPRKITIRGADALGIPLAKSPTELLADLNLIDKVVEEEEPRDELKHLENTQPLRPGNGKIPALENLLAIDLHSGGSNIVLSWPSEFDEEPGEIAQYKILSSGAVKPPLHDELELECIITPLEPLQAGERFSKLRSMRIQGLSEEGSALTREISADKWLMYQTEMDDQRYVFHRGRWYNIGGAYLEMLKSKLERIFSRQCDIQFPAWPKQKKTRKSTGDEYLGWANEGVYNDLVVGEQAGYVTLDRKLVKSTQHPRGFESCDFLTPDNRLVHVKRLDDSVAASHLFNQAANSAEALTRQPDALAAFRKKVEEVSGGEKVLPEDFSIRTVVLAFAGKGRSADDMFTFSQVSLSRCAQRIGSLGLKLEVAFINETNDVIDVPEDYQS